MVKHKLPQPDDVLIDPPVNPIPVVDPEVVPDAIAKAKLEVASAAVPEAKPAGPVIEYVGEGADKIEFTINPRAARYVVNANGLVLESF